MLPARAIVTLSSVAMIEVNGWQLAAEDRSVGVSCTLWLTESQL